MLDWTRIAWNKVRGLTGRAARERDMDEEMRFHLEMEAAELRRAGVPAAEAERLARATFGGVERQKDDARDAVGIRLMQDVAQDLRYSIRQMRASPGYTAATLLTLTLGVGAAAAVYTIQSAVMVRQVPFSEPTELVHVAQGTIGGCLSCWRIATGNYMTLRDASRTVHDLALVAGWSPVLRGTEHTEVVNGSRVTPGFFEMLRIPPMLGRTIVSADSTPERQNIVVVSESFWKAKLGGDSAAVGSAVVLDGVPRTIIGVILQRYVFPSDAMVWTPRLLGAVEATDRSWTNDNAVGRLRPGTTLAQAQAELALIGARVAASNPAAMRHWSFGVMPFTEWQSPVRKSDTAPLELAVAMLLAIACVNLAGLLLARLTTRRRELAVRVAMGAGSARIARQLLTETVLLALISALLGAAVAAGAVHALRDAMPSFVAENLPNWRSMRVDAAALFVSIGVATLTGIVIGLWPAVRFSRADVVSELKDGARSATSTGGVSRGRRGLVVVEIALAIMLLAAAGLLARSVHNLHAVDPGFRADHLLTFRITAPPRLPGDGMPLDSLRYERLAARLEALPDVVSASAVFGLPYGHAASTNGFKIEGRPADSPLRGASVQMVPAGTNYFATLGVPILRGRSFAITDRGGSQRVAIIDAAVARRFFANEDPIGRTVIIDSVSWQIVGVAGATRRDARGRVISQVPGQIYRPMAQWFWRSPEFVLRTRGDPEEPAAAAIRAVREFDPSVAVTRVASMEDLMKQDVAPDRVLAAMIAIFAAAATLISAIGLYGVINYSVAQRMREFGIRRALGAESWALLTLVLGQGARLAAIGALLGVAGALSAARLMGALLFGVSPTDPLTMTGVAVGMCVVALGAAYVPARRATRVDPMVSLREE